MADRKASQEPKAVALGSADFWAAVQGGTDVQISVQQIYDFVRNGMVGASSGKAPTLGADGKLDASVIPAVAITDTFVVASQAAMLALDAERGDIAIRTDLNRSFVLKTDEPGTLANWQELLTPTDAVLSVAGLTGAITPAALRAALALSISNISGLQSALDALAAADATLRSDMNTGLGLKANLTGAAFTGYVNFGSSVGLPGTGTNRFEAGSGDNATFATHNLRLLTHWGFAIADYRGTVRGVYDARTGVWNTLGVPQVNGSSVWYPGNFNPELKADLNASVSFSALTITGATTLGSLTVSGATQLASLNISARPTWAGLTPWDNGNFNPSAKLDVAGGVPTGQLNMKASVGGTIASRAGDGSFLQVRAEDGQGAAAMTFHRQNSFATWFGLDTDNEFKFGGWSEGAASYRFWTSKNFNPATKADLNGSVAFSAVSAPQITVTGGGGAINMNARDGGTSSILYQSVEAFRVYMDGNDKLRVHSNGNIWTPYFGYLSDQFAAKASLGATVAFGGVTLGGSEAYLYSDGVAASNIVFRTGNGTVGYRYSYFDKTGFLTAAAGIRANGHLYTTGNVIVGEGQTSSTIEMRDTDDGNRSVHNNSGCIGFLGSDGGWKFQVRDDGSLWSLQLGDLNSRIETRASAFAASARNDANANANNRVAKTGDTMTGDLGINKAYPSLNLYWGGVIAGSWMIDSDGAMAYRNTDNGAQYYRFQTSGRITSISGWRMETDGNLYMPWYGDYLSTALARKVDVTSSARFDMSGTIAVTNYLDIVRGNVLRARFLVDGGGTTILQNGDTGDNFFYVTAGGAVWTKQFGDLNNRIESRAAAFAADAASSRVAKTGDTMTGQLEIQSGYPSLMLHYPGVRWFQWQTREDGRLHLHSHDSSYILSVGIGGDIVTKQFGDLNSRIENRANDYARMYAGRVTGRWAHAGDLDGSWNANAGNYAEPYGGAALTSLNNRYSTNPAFYFTAGGRWRYFQMKNIDDAWYTIGYA